MTASTASFPAVSVMNATMNATIANRVRIERAERARGEVAETVRGNRGRGARASYVGRDRLK
jgi:hypothetical protein